MANTGPCKTRPIARLVSASQCYYSSILLHYCIPLTYSILLNSQHIKSGSADIAMHACNFYLVLRCYHEQIDSLRLSIWEF